MRRGRSSEGARDLGHREWQIRWKSPCAPRYDEISRSFAPSHTRSQAVSRRLSSRPEDRKGDQDRPVPTLLRLPAPQVVHCDGRHEADANEQRRVITLEQGRVIDRLLCIHARWGHGQ
jgi:hypothetical protein